jgi:hypothetical protein
MVNVHLNIKRLLINWPLRGWSIVIDVFSYLNVICHGTHVILCYYISCKFPVVEGKIIDVAVKKTNHSMHLPKQSHETKSQEFPEHFHSFTDIIFQFKFRL